MFSHLGKNGANVQMNFARVRDFQALIYRCRLSCVEAGVLEIERLLKVAECVSQFVGLSEQASIVVISDGL